MRDHTSLPLPACSGRGCGHALPVLAMIATVVVVVRAAYCVRGSSQGINARRLDSPLPGATENQKPITTTPFRHSSFVTLLVPPYPLGSKKGLPLS